MPARDEAAKVYKAWIDMTATLVKKMLDANTRTVWTKNYLALNEGESDVFIFLTYHTDTAQEAERLLQPVLSKANKDLGELGEPPAPSTDEELSIFDWVKRVPDIFALTLLEHFKQRVVECTEAIVILEDKAKEAEERAKLNEATWRCEGCGQPIARHESNTTTGGPGSVRCSIKADGSICCSHLPPK